MEPAYDRYNADEDLSWSFIRFTPQRFEVWMNGQMIKSAKTSCILTLDLEENGLGYRGLGQIEVRHNESALWNTDLGHETMFDMFGSQGNRLVLLTIPTVTNAATCVGMVAMQHRWPHSRYEHDFASNEPYCCSIFTVNGRVAKITFSLANPEKLVEFYGF